MYSEAAARLLSRSHPSLSTNSSSSEATSFDSRDDDQPQPPRSSTIATTSSPSSKRARFSQPTIPLMASSNTSSSTSTIPLTVVRQSSTIRSTPSASPSSPTHKLALKPATVSSNPPSTNLSHFPASHPRPSLLIPPNLAPNSYPVLFSPKSPPQLRKKHSELALRLGDVMGEIHRHEKEKREVQQLTHRRALGEEGGRRLSASVGVADWKPYEEKKQKGGEKLNGELEVKKPTVNQRAVVEIKGREGKYADAVNHVLSDIRYQYLSIALTLICLYLHDLCYAVMPKTADSAVSVILLLIFIFLCVEVVVQCVVKKNYFCSFFFFMDVIGTVSLIFDISFIVNSFWSSSSLTTSSTSSNRVTQSASVIRFTRFARVLRVIRLIRIVRLLRYHPPVPASRHPSKIGLHLSGLIDKRVILMMLGMVIILPFLTADTAPTDQSAALGLELLVDSVSMTDFQTVANQLVQTEGDDLFYLFVQGGPIAGANGMTLVDNRDAMSYLRVDELNEYTEGSSTLRLSIRQSVYLTACYSMATTSLIIVVFAIGSFLITRNVHSLVVAPLERMTQIIRKLAGTVCFLTAATEADARELDDGLETNVIEATIEKMARIFAVQPDGNNALPKPLQMMAGSKHTEIMTNSSIVSIEVTERPKALQNERIVDDGSISDDRSTWLDADPAIHRELASIDEILTHPLVIPYFELHLASCFVSENLQFSLEVDRYRSIIRSHALHLHNSFVSTRAHNAINIDGRTKAKIADGLEDPSFALFDEAQKECLEGMRGHWRSFLKSRWCRGYVRKAEQMDKMRKRMVKGKSRVEVEELKEAENGGEVQTVTILPGKEGMLEFKQSMWSPAGATERVHRVGSDVTGLGRDRSASDDRVWRDERKTRTGTMQDFPGAVNLDGRLREEE